MRNHTHEAPARARPLAPVFFALLIGILAHAVLAGCGGGQTSGTSATATESPAPVSTPTGGTEPVTGPADGVKVYAARCALCHGAEGKGDGPAAAALNPKPRNHTDGTYMNARTDEELLKVIKDGKGAMPAWGAVLSEEEIQAVLKHIRTLAK